MVSVILIHQTDRVFLILHLKSIFPGAAANGSLDFPPAQRKNDSNSRELAKVLIP